MANERYASQIQLIQLKPIPLDTHHPCAQSILYFIEIRVSVAQLIEMLTHNLKIFIANCKVNAFEI